MSVDWDTRFLAARERYLAAPSIDQIDQLIEDFLQPLADVLLTSEIDDLPKHLERLDAPAVAIVHCWRALEKFQPGMGSAREYFAGVICDVYRGGR